MRVSSFLLLIAFLAVPFFSASSSSFLASPFQNIVDGVARGFSSGSERTDATVSGVEVNSSLATSSFLVLPQVGPETITIYRSDCTTLDNGFALGDTVCAKITGAPAFRRRLAFVNPGGHIVSQVTVTSDPQTLEFTLPTSATSMFGENTVDNRGKWRVNSIEWADSDTRVVGSFVVSDAAQPVADVSISKAAGQSQVAAGSLISFSVFIYNNGPDPAANVEMVDIVPTNTTFVSQYKMQGQQPLLARPPVLQQPVRRRA